MSVRIEEGFGFIINDLARFFRRAFEKELEREGVPLTPACARALVYAAAFSGQRQIQLAERMNVEPMTLVNQLDTLEGMGFVERLPDPSDRRCKIIVVKDEAQELVKQLKQVGARVREHAAAGLSEEDVRHLQETLIKMRDELASLPGNPESTS
ncbi:MarR family transcriptional regulator [Rhodobacteraceae bacterium RKSG542]|uniref:MarR family winged helix-turn-helix transcriptional regulator n=1 Tax=Pseudovibrio flavus TaxID=2529854 RepID=UPI0012BB5352|nr:MarR family transcriptional regulator [Pseudovibrio flavus]MTI18349.1 MarR family transcriptional regulator [Pseudovibrio flavus]